MQEVQLTHEANTAMDVYRELYLARYKTKPIIQSAQFAFAMTTFKDLIRDVGLERTLALIRQYLRMNGDQDWYKRQGHNIQTFAKNLDAINAATPNSHTGQQKEFLIEIETRCPVCQKFFQLTTSIDKVSDVAYMTNCRECSRKPSF